ncbi:uncharacterized protein PRCAT00001971001 [Priceomyces carsonii]|uniref:uncharacterized protein n=1 Tax=Priceomyces carsonii TaxID=28549 RepID=UPI002EDA54F7|nr:unnamed protein product [Priceomyces carsonii]
MTRSLSEKQEHDVQIEPIKSFTNENIKHDDVIATILSVEGKEVNLTGDVDEAMQLALKADHIHIDEETNKRLLRKTDLYLMPLLCFLYSCQFMDKVSNSYAAVMGLRTDLNMVGDMYSWCGSAFYLGYLFFEFPASALLQRFPVSKAVSCFIVIWGIVLCLHSAPNYAGFIFLRTVLGMLESAVTPAMVIITGQWYKAEEQFTRTSIWFSFNGFGTIMGSAIAYGLAIRAESYSIEAWKILFIVTGLMTIVVGIAFYIHIPDSPATAWFLTEEEKLLVVERIRSNQQGFGNKHFKMHQLREALTDQVTWLYFFFGLASDIPNGSLTNFGSILLSEDFGYSATESLLMNMPTGAVEVVGCTLFGLLQRYVPHRMFIAIFATVVTLASACMLAFASESKNARLGGYYLMTVSPVGMICALSCFSSNTAGHTKKLVANAIFLIGYCVGNLIGPQTFIAAQAPSYTGGKVSIVVCYAASLVLLVWIYAVYYFENKKRDKLRENMGDSYVKIENSEFADLTDKENPDFRYRL